MFGHSLAKRMAVFGAAVLGLASLSPAQAAPSQMETFDGIVRINNCSAALVKLPGAKNTDPAVLLTNGHCVRTTNIMPGEVVVDQDATRLNTHVREADFFKGSQPRSIATSAKITKVLYGTTTGTDLALMEVNKSYLTLSLSGVKPRTLAEANAAIGTPLSIPSGLYLSNSFCEVEAIVPTLHGGNGYVWNNSRRYAPGCTTRAGTSGAPMLDRTSGQIVGINNAGFDTIDDCTVDNPCGEQKEDGSIVPILDAKYGQETAQILGCVSGGKFSLKTPGCTLPKPERY